MSRAISIPVLICLLLGACAVGPNYHRPATVAPPRYKNAVPAATGQSVPEQPPPDRWWTLFQDETLTQLIEQVDVSNQNLAQAAAAYAQAEAVVRQDRAAFLPTVSVDASATRVAGGSRTGTAATVGSVAVTTPGSSAGRSTTLYQVTGSASWELDVWGRLRRALESSRETAHADLADLAAARSSAQAQLATAYLQLRGADAELTLLQATVAGYERTLQITRNRYAVGAAPKTDVLQAQTQLLNAQQQQAATSLQRAQLENSVAALTGQAASDFRLAPRETWNIPIPQIPAGVPTTLLQRRPDIKAAEHLVAAANASIGVQEAAYFPAFTLTGTYGFLSSTVSRLFEAANASRQAALSGAQTVLDFGATRARVAQARAQYDQAVATYRQTVIAALQSVENDLAASDWDRRQYELLQQSSQAADETERLTLNEYKAGTVDYTTVVVAQAAALSARLALAQITVSRQTAAVSLVADLGGGWTPAAQSKP